MPFPAVRHCLVCEDLRQEVNRKTTILGFYGITPNVGILVRAFDQPIGRLAFVLLTEEIKEAGKFKLTPRLLRPDGEPLVDLPALETEIAAPSFRTQLGFGFGSVKLPGPGIYSLVLLVDEKEHYRTSFSVEQGKPEDFKD